ncbi:unnamed protein product [Dovyalis caffra]|uniref:Uncharacterized protein n=1 Tax=Dovyalis caffra TaxID=77055 RepID=A0AAV1RXX7_9ROSI|nr:unnamed protein product [Dovyalis caffra]
MSTADKQDWEIESDKLVTYAGRRKWPMIGRHVSRSNNRSVISGTGRGKEKRLAMRQNLMESSVQCITEAWVPDKLLRDALKATPAKIKTKTVERDKVEGQPQNKRKRGRDETQQQILDEGKTIMSWMFYYWPIGET